MGPRVLVTGAAGFIGGACAAEFIRRSWPVTVLAHRRAAEGLAGVALVGASLTNLHELSAVLAGQGPFDVIVNCAGQASDVGPRSSFRVNDLGVRNLIEMMPSLGVRRLVHISTTDIYDLRNFRDADEQTPPAARPANRYPLSKLRGEREIFQRLRPEQYVILRPGVVWGPGDKSILPRVVSHLGRSSSIIHFGRMRGDNRWPLAHVRNLARAAALAATYDEAAGQVYNVVDPERTTMDEYYRLVLRYLLPHRPQPRSVTLPFALGWCAGAVSTALSNLLGRSQPLFDPTIYSLRSVASDLDFSGRKLQQLFAAHDEKFITRTEGFEELGRLAAIAQGGG